MPRKAGSGTSEASKQNLTKARLRTQLNKIIQKAAAETDPRNKLTIMKEANTVSNLLDEKHHFSEADLNATETEIRELKKNIFKELKAEHKAEKAPKKKKKVDEPESNIIVRKQEVEPAAPKKAGRPKGSKKAVGNIAEVLNGEAQKARVAPLEREELTPNIIKYYAKELDRTKKHIEDIQEIVKRHMT